MQLSKDSAKQQRSKDVGVCLSMTGEERRVLDGVVVVAHARVRACVRLPAAVLHADTPAKQTTKERE